MRSHEATLAHARAKRRGCAREPSIEVPRPGAIARARVRARKEAQRYTYDDADLANVCRFSARRRAMVVVVVAVVK